MPEILPLDQIQSGMSGVAYTVVDNSGKIEPFNVDIIGLIDNGKGSSKMIMAKASGAVIDKTGGVLQGMSGSPVYINGKLVGALAAGLKEMSPYTFFITPIEDMLPLWDMPDPKAENKYQQVDLKTEDNKEKKSDVEEVDKDKINDKDINQKSDNDKDKDKDKD
ncbi:MAG: SpoIVB peptidase S55 domain protein, partial [Selenomonadaceae bacterium]|nr:SpoIVB peptidase S55 domain protein [Selenomonadaceae bacterium]